MGVAMDRVARGVSAWEAVVRMVTHRWRKSAPGLWTEAMDPIARLTVQQAQAIFDHARSGNYAQLQRIYAEIERTDPTLLVCVMRRQAAASELEWKVVRADARRFGGRADGALADEQMRCLEEGIAHIDNLPEAVEHLALAAFRGFSHVTPIHGADGRVKTLDCLDSWNFCFDRRECAWLWNPSASSFMMPDSGDPGLERIPAEELVTVVNRMPIDWPAIRIYLRRSLAESDWGVFVQDFGIPPVILTMPEFTREEDVPQFLQAAKSAFSGKNGVVPFGTGVNYATDARGQDPFGAFIDHQERLVVLMATGGLLTSLSEAGSGTLAGSAHQETWRSIARRDSRFIANAIQRQLCVRILDREFPGQPHLAEFAFDTETAPTPKEVMELTGLARAGGLRMDAGEISDMTGYKVTDDPAAAAGAGMPQIGIAANSGSIVPFRDGTGRVVLNAAPPKRGMSDAERLALALRADFRDVADRINAIVQMPEGERPEAARRLLSELDSLVPDDPVMAEVIASVMASAFIKGAGEGGAETATVINAITNPCPKCHRQMSADGICTSCAKRAANKAQIAGLIAELDKKGPDGRGKGWKDRTENLGALDVKTIADIKRANPRMDVDNSVATVNTIQLRHAIDHHGNAKRESIRNQIPITKDDLAKIPDVLSDYDRIEAGKGIGEGKAQESVIFRKAYPDGTIACVELDVYNDSMKRRTLKFQTMWKEKE